MVGRSRFGGIYSVLSQRELSTLKDFETFLELQDPDIEEDLLKFAGDKVQDLTIEEMIDGIELYIEWMQMSRGETYGSSEDPDYTKQFNREIREEQRLKEKGLTSSERVREGQSKGQSRHWEGQLSTILHKLKRHQTKQEPRPRSLLDTAMSMRKRASF